MVEETKKELFNTLKAQLVSNGFSIGEAKK
jgi:hypothetical protein